ncbi:hypothetical protein HPB49_002764 [Dermacentor silvarum]|uniref:Uncharacterized protein n=1 Tax=Dermacentor silvarum TaxID=543639 RepID=A0ACB8DA80_DERSI|nr:hypothetical protein HPB49_002764 [Dermacentor silvarum]
MHTATLNLELHGVTNTLEELIEAHQAAQLTHLSSTSQGRNLLSSLGYPPSPTVLTSTGLSPAARAKLTVSPIPRHMHPTRHIARRDHRSRYLRREYPVGCSAVRVLFTDANPADERGGVTVVVDSDLMTVFAASERTLTDVSLLEERVIARAILSTSSLPPSTPNHILTDSQAACRRFLFNTLHPTTTSILESFLSSTSHTFRLVWVPGTQRSPVMSALMRWPENSHTEPLCHHPTATFLVRIPTCCDTPNSATLPLTSSCPYSLAGCLLATTTDEYFPDAPFLFVTLPLPWSSSMPALR